MFFQDSVKWQRRKKIIISVLFCTLRVIIRTAYLVVLVRYNTVVFWMYNSIVLNQDFRHRCALTNTIILMHLNDESDT